MKKNAVGFGLFLVIAGVLWILNMLDVFSVPIFTSFSKLWPLIFIALGLSMIFGRKQIVSFAIWIVFIAVILCYSIFGPFGGIFDDKSDRGNAAEEFTRTEELGSVIEKGIMDLEVGGASINTGATDSELFNADIYDKDIVFETGGEKTADVRIYSSVRNRSTSSQDQYRWNVNLSDKIPWEMILSAGAVKGDLDFSSVMLEKLDVNIGASSLDIKFSDLSSFTEVTIKAGASSIKMEIPEGMGVKIKLDGALVTKNFSNAGLEKNGDYYYSDNYDGSEQKIEIDIEMGVGNIDLKFR